MHLSAELSPLLADVLNSRASTALIAMLAKRLACILANIVDAAIR